MRVVGLREGVDVGLENVLAAGLRQTLELVLVALGQQLLDRLGFLAGDLQAQHLVLDPLAPQLVECLAVRGPRRLLAVDLEAFVGAEVELLDALVEQGEGELQAFLHAFELALVDDEAGLQLAALQVVVEAMAPGLEVGNVAGGEVAARRVETLQVVVEHL
ncbi:hypothetical protein D3C75_616660 [compost metagenome]